MTTPQRRIRPRVVIGALIVGSVLALLPRVLGAILYPDVVCIYPGPNGESLKGRGKQCDHPGAIRLGVKEKE